MRGRRGFRLEPGGLLAFLLAFVIMGYTGVNLMRYLGPPIGRLLSRPPAARPTLVASEDLTPQTSGTATVGQIAATQVVTSAVSASTTSTPTLMRVANTDGQGVYLRRTPRMDDRWLAWADRERMEVLEASIVVDGITWHKVRDPNGNVGYIPSQYLVPFTQ